MRARFGGISSDRGQGDGKQYQLQRDKLEAKPGRDGSHGMLVFIAAEFNNPPSPDVDQVVMWAVVVCFIARSPINAKSRRFKMPFSSNSRTVR
jgi:hypothetical protein